MVDIDYEKIALEYARGLNFGYDTVRFAGMKNGYVYYQYCREDDLKHRRKLGLPQYVKISKNGKKIIEVETLKEKMWALQQVILIHNLRKPKQHFFVKGQYNLPYVK